MIVCVALLYTCYICSMSYILNHQAFASPNFSCKEESTSVVVLDIESDCE